MAATKKTHFKYYPSMHDVLQDARKGGYSYTANRRDDMAAPTTWSGGDCIDVCADIDAGKADPDTLRHMDELVNKIDASFRGREAQQWEPSVCGAYACVPDYLMGMPDNMREKLAVEDDTAPIRIYVEISYSAGVSEDAIAKRGATLAALVMRMSEERAVELHAYAGWMLNTCDDANMLWSVKLDTSPVNLTQVIATISNRGFCRAVNFNVCDAIRKEDTGRGIPKREPFAWAFNKSRDDSKRRALLKEFFNLSEKDVMIERGYLTENKLMETDPVAWVHAQLEKQRTVE